MASSAFAQTRLIVVGGGLRPHASNELFFRWSGGNNARILVPAWGTDDSEGYYQAFADDILPMGPKSMEMAPAVSDMPAKKAIFLQQLRNATGVWFTGGDQNLIMTIVQDAQLRDALRLAFARGVVFGGTSAGCAIMSDPMITGLGDMSVIDGSKVGIAQGLGLLPGPFLDQHFLARQRQNRLFGLVLKFPDRLGIGIDEGTAIAIEDGDRFTVLGTSYVTIASSHSNYGTQRLNMELLQNGDTFSLSRRQKLSPAFPPASVSSQSP